MKTVIMTMMFSIVLCGVLCAQTATKPPVVKLARTIDPAARSNMLAKTGGLIQAPVEGPSILFLNVQTCVSAPAMDSVATQIGVMLRLPVTSQTKPGVEPVTEALKSLENKGTAAVLVIGDTAGYPSLLIAPENRWALVNIAALRGEGVSHATLEERAQKEVWRAFGYLMGAANSNFEHCLLKPVLTPADLDALKSLSLSPEPFNKIMMQAQKLGITPLRTTSYRKAVEEGWAPAPTNVFQIAIWNALKK